MENVIKQVRQENAIGVFAGVMEGVSAGVQVAAVSLLAAVPATAFIAKHGRATVTLKKATAMSLP